MQKIIMTKGLPASGKTTWAKKFVESHQGRWKRINKDDLRTMVDAGIWTAKNEEFILEVRDSLIIKALKDGYNVIVDDTNLHSKHKNQLWKIAAKYNAKLEVKDFTNVSLEECLDRDSKRQNAVGARVIKEMYKKYLKPEVPVIKYKKNLPEAIICDLDGTLALANGADWYDRDFTKDSVNEPIRDIVNNFAVTGMFIFLVSGRKSEYINETTTWLIKNGIIFNKLQMRPEKDIRKDAIVKKEIYESEIKNKFNVKFVLDDRNQVVDLWRSLGLTCLQVAEGDF